MDTATTAISGNTKTPSAVLILEHGITALQQKTKRPLVTGLANTFGNHG